MFIFFDSVLFLIVFFKYCFMVYLKHFELPLCLEGATPCAALTHWQTCSVARIIHEGWSRTAVVKHHAHQEF